MTLDLSPVRALVGRLDDSIARKRDAYLSAPRPAGEPERVKLLLAHLVDVDQHTLHLGAALLDDARRLSKAQADALHEELAKVLHSVCDAHAKELEALLDRHEWIKISVFGFDADSHAWLLAQHADHRPDLQKRVLAVLERMLPLKETSGANYAYLWDRVAVNEGRPQRYGTQGSARDGLWTPKPLEDAAGVDALRKSVGLEPLADYAARFRR